MDRVSGIETIYNGKKDVFRIHEIGEVQMSNRSD